ncbi:MAG: hypothetical protein UT48_C0013G0006 [Parcubacteria group bacterium GW2011_GWE2_39_37]|uniref:DUF3006 domain-containing protein n=1 Tax=Candidatus Falkowbacteria bacterium GW2011_GWF2_39_8 TaxID=1618642 RepID=A0A0G0Q228_9BACT|nr:MAG: hypothetical protein UT48_C0013G0006 [Parcubacteria group bacterium GW2011_GWE2_39_37]KKR31421.1 MAG: hypothetical protein UT64_C0061G0003 [Candidatus Falkowbacteria bacterium GW2011_GWF2_39_8]
MEIIFIIDRIEGETAVLKADDFTINWPKNKLPQTMREGEALSFQISTKEEVEAKNKKQAKDLLNEILNVKE